MPGLVESELAAARQLDRGADAPPFFLDFSALDILGLQRLDLRGQIVDHEVEHGAELAMPGMLGLRVFVARMNRGLCTWKLEDQPAVSGVDVREAEHVAKERAIGLGIVTVEKNVGADEHGGSLYLLLELVQQVQRLDRREPIEISGLQAVDNLL